MRITPSTLSASRGTGFAANQTIMGHVKEVFFLILKQLLEYLWEDSPHPLQFFSAQILSKYGVIHRLMAHRWERQKQCWDMQRAPGVIAISLLMRPLFYFKYIYIYKIKRKKKTNPVNRRKKKKVEIQKMIVRPARGHAEEAWLAF